MFKSFLKLAVIIAFACSVSGCAIIGTALSAGAAYGIYQATHQ